jgi:SNF2 family DNA or RNA helicase
VLRIESNFTTRPSLIVCPAALVFHWESEIGRHFPALLMTAKRAGKPLKAPPALSPSDVLIISYDRLRGDASLQKIKWAMLILDEAHVIRNPATVTAQRVFSLRSQSRLALTGTPVQNHVEEVWSLMNFLLPDYLGELSLSLYALSLFLSLSFSYSILISLPVSLLVSRSCS